MMNCKIFSRNLTEDSNDKHVYRALKRTQNGSQFELIITIMVLILYIYVKPGMRLPLLHCGTFRKLKTS